LIPHEQQLPDFALEIRSSTRVAKPRPCVVRACGGVPTAPQRSKLPRARLRQLVALQPP